MIDQTTLNERLESARRVIDRRKDRLARGDRKYHSAARVSFSAAAYTLHLGDPVEGRRLFAEAAAYRAGEAYVQLLHSSIRRLKHTENGVTASILSSSPQVRDTMASIAVKNVDANATETAWARCWAHRIATLAALATGDDHEASKRLDAFAAVEGADKYDKHDFAEYQAALTTLYRGLLDRDVTQLERGCRIASDIVTAYNDFDHGQDLICQQALAGLELARERGLDVRVDHEAIPEAIYSTEWREAPAPELSDTARLVLDAIDDHDPESGDPFPLLADEE